MSPCRPHTAALMASTRPPGSALSNLHLLTRFALLRSSSLFFARSYCRCPSDTGLQLRLMIGLGFTAFLVAAIIVALDLKFGWSQKKGGGRLKPIINAIQSLTVLIMFPAKVRKREEKTQRGRDEERKRPTSCAVTCVCTLLLNSGIPLGSQPACIRQLTTTL